MAYKPGAELLRRYLRSLPTSGIDETLYPDIIAIEADKAAVKREKALDEAKTATLNAAQSVGELAAGTAQAAGSAAVEGLQAAGVTAKSALGAAGGLLGSLASRAKASRAASSSESHADDTFESNLQKVKKLKELLDCGILTQEEFDSKKRELLEL